MVACVPCQLQAHHNIIDGPDFVSSRRQYYPRLASAFTRNKASTYTRARVLGKILVKLTQTQLPAGY